jgi:hypothetical protein
MTRNQLTLSFEQITVNFLNHYENWMLQYGRKSQKKFGPGSPTSRTIVGIYLRQIRAFLMKPSVEKSLRTIHLVKEIMLFQQEETSKKI